MPSKDDDDDDVLFRTAWIRLLHLMWNQLNTMSTVDVAASVIQSHIVCINQCFVNE